MANTPIVRHISETFLKPKYDVEDAKNPVYLAPGDLIMLSSHYIQKGLLFPKPPSITNLLDNLKHSLSLALVHYYPLAGQLDSQIDDHQHTTLIFINCTKGPGTRFIHAALEISISDILTPKHVPKVVHSLFDHHKAVNHDGHTRPLLSIQVTELVDGVFIGCSMNHACCDGTSYWNFFNSWSEIFMSNSNNTVISRPPIHKRWFVDGFGPKINLPYVHPDEFLGGHETPELTERIFHFSASSIAKLKEKANLESGVSNSISSFQSLTALIWRAITRARNPPPDVQTTCRLAINSRGRLDPPLSSYSFGAAVYVVQATTNVGELLGQNLGWAASLVHQAVVEYNSEKALSVMRGLSEAPFVVKMGEFVDPYIVHVGSSPRFEMYGSEFGMGKALGVFSGYANKFDGKLSAFPGRDGGGSVDIELTLLPDYMRKLEFDEEFMEAVSKP